MTAPSPTDWAYLAGLIDGEGWVGEYRSGYARRVGQPGTPNSRVEIYNQSQALVAWLSATFGGYVRTRTAENSASPLTRHSVYIWRVQGARAREVLSKTAPWRHVKGPLMYDWPEPGA